MSESSTVQNRPAQSVVLINKVFQARLKARFCDSQICQEELLGMYRLHLCKCLSDSSQNLPEISYRVARQSYWQVISRPPVVLGICSELLTCRSAGMLLTVAYEDHDLYHFEVYGRPQTILKCPELP